MRNVKIWLNKPQLKSWLIQAKEEYGVWGRATGKTQGPIAQRSSHAANMMPRGATGIIGTTYMQLLDRTLPPLFKAWEKLGYVYGKHYWVRTMPNPKLNIPAAIYPVLTPEHCVTWWNGHVFHLISQDRPGLANGKNLDAIIADEVRFLNHDRYMDDIAPTNRGNREFFGHLAEHHMVTMYTDMPTNPSGKWIFDKEEQVDPDKINQIIHLQVEANRIELEINHPLTTKPRAVYLSRKLKGYITVLNELRKDSVWYSEASSLDNIQILGEGQIKQWRREMKWPVFQSSILNKRIIQNPKGFFYLFDEDYHCYEAYDYQFIDSLGLHLPEGVLEDCRKDGDLIKGKPIDIGMDYNADIKSLVAGQETHNYYRVIKSMYALAEDRKILTDLIDDFCTYYKHHDCHEVNYYYDHTAMGTDATRLKTLADIVTDQFQLNKWIVNRYNIGQQPQHDIRYRLWETVFQEKDRRFKPVRFNRTNAESVRVSIMGTGVRQGQNGFKKDKTPEKRKSVKPQDAPHQGDAFETLYIGKFKNDYGYAEVITEMMTG